MFVRFALGVMFIAGVFIEPASAAAPSVSGIPCSGVWKINEQLTKRARPRIAPIYQFFAPWGENGWVRLRTEDLNATERGEWQFEQFDNKPYPTFGTDPSLVRSRKITDHIIATARIREGRENDIMLVIFSQDCKRVTFYAPEGEDRNGAPGQNRFYNDIRVFDKVEP